MTENIAYFTKTPPFLQHESNGSEDSVKDFYEQVKDFSGNGTNFTMTRQKANVRDSGRLRSETFLPPNFGIWICPNAEGCAWGFIASERRGYNPASLPVETQQHRSARAGSPTLNFLPALISSSTAKWRVLSNKMIRRA